MKAPLPNRSDVRTSSSISAEVFRNTSTPSTRTDPSSARVLYRPVTTLHRMTEAVIVATARSPIGRAVKGSLVDLRPDDMSAQIVKALMAKVPSVSPRDVEDLIMGCGQPAGEAGFNIARVVGLLAGLDDVPGVTVNRYCSSSLQTIRMAAHAIKAGEGDCFIAAGVETVSRYGAGASDTAPNPIFKTSGLRTQERSQGGAPVWTPPEGLPDIYIAMGQTAENVVQAEGRHPRGDGRVRGARQDRAVANVENGFWAGRSPRSRCPTGPRCRRTTGRGRAPPSRASVSSSRCSGPTVGHRRQRLPAQRRRRGGDGDERHESGATRSHAAGTHRVDRCLGPQPGDHGPRPDRRQPPGAGAGRHDDRRHRSGRDQRGVRRPR